MTDPELALLGGGAGTTIVAGCIAFARWAMALWATVRREDIATAKETAALQRAESARMVEALLESARSNEALAGEHAKSIALLCGKLDLLAARIDSIGWREQTPVEIPALREPSERNRLRTPPRGSYRPPRPGEHDDH